MYHIKINDERIRDIKESISPYQHTHTHTHLTHTLTYTPPPTPHPHPPPPPPTDIDSLSLHSISVLWKLCCYCFPLERCSNTKQTSVRAPIVSENNKQNHNYYCPACRRWEVKENRDGKQKLEIETHDWKEQDMNHRIQQLVSHKSR